MVYFFLVVVVVDVFFLSVCLFFFFCQISNFLLIFHIICIIFHILKKLRNGCTHCKTLFLWTDGRVRGEIMGWGCRYGDVE